MVWWRTTFRHENNNVYNKRTAKNKDKFASYSASIVTNGYLLTEKVAKQLKKLNIENVQITLDGPAYIHNKRRYLKASKNQHLKLFK